MTDILITNGIVITMDPGRRVIEGGAVAIAGSRIVEIGDSADLAERHQAKQTIDASRKAVMPGLIDCHAHAGHGLVKTLGTGDVDAWGAACERIYSTGSDEAFWRAEALLSALERLKCGTTCGVSYLGGGDDIMRTDDPVFGARHCEAVGEVGIRAVLAAGPCRPPFPRTFARWDGERRDDRAISFADQLDTCDALIGRWHGTGRIGVSLTFPVHHERIAAPGSAAFDEIGEQARAVRDLSRRRGVRFTQDGHRGGSIEIAYQAFDLLGPDAYLSHCIDMTAREIELCRETGTSIVHNPSANISIQGRCPVPELIDAGVPVALGSDGTAPDRSFDMFRHMFQCMHYQRTHFRDARYLPPGKLLEMVTIDAAGVLGMADEIGSLEAGKKADVILIDLFKPHLYPFNMPLYRIPYFATGADVDTVIVDGEVLMAGRRVTTVDEAEVLDTAQAETERMLERTGLHDLLATPPRFWGASHY